MKLKQLLIILLLIVVRNSFGQGLNGEIEFNDDYDQNSGGIVCIGEFSYFIKNQPTSNDFFTKSSLLKIDTLEHVIWEVPINPIFNPIINPIVAETYQVYEIIPSENGGVYILGTGLSTCDVVSDCFWFIEKINSSAEVEWTKIFENPNCFNNTLNTPSGLSLDAVNNIHVNFSNDNESKIYTLDNHGALIDSLVIGIREISQIDLSSGFEFIASKDNMFIGFDSTGIIQNSLSYSSPISDFITLNDTIFLITSDSIFSYHANFTPIAGLNLAGYSGYSNLHSFNGVLSLVSHTNNYQNILTIGHDLQFLNVIQIPVSLNFDDQKDFSTSHFASSSHFPLTMFQSVRHLDFSLNSPSDVSVNRTDVGIIDLVTTQIDIQNQFGNAYLVKVYAEALIKNYGTNVLNECRINHSNGPGYCTMDFYTNMFSNLNIAPGDSTWVNLGLVHTELTNVITGTDTLQVDICVYTSHPNFKTDLIVQNDQYCENVVFGFVNVDELVLLGKEKKLIRIVDLMGREVRDNSNSTLIYIYNDGTTEKVFKID